MTYEPFLFTLTFFRVRLLCLFVVSDELEKNKTYIYLFSFACRDMEAVWFQTEQITFFSPSLSPSLPLSRVDSDCGELWNSRARAGEFHHYLERREQGRQDYLLSYTHSNK